MDPMHRFALSSTDTTQKLAIVNADGVDIACVEFVAPLEPIFIRAALDSLKDGYERAVGITPTSQENRLAMSKVAMIASGTLEKIKGMIAEADANVAA